MDDIQKRIEGLQRNHTELMQRKAGNAGQLQARKDELASIAAEIREAGFDPKQITQARDQARAELLEEIDKLEREFADVKAALDGFPATK